MPRTPRDTAPDSTLALLRDGYDFIPKRCRRYGSDIFETRLMFTPVVCMQGEAAARAFYEPGRFTRRGAIPLLTLVLLQDKDSVATLDGEIHNHRKRMFMSVMTPGSLSRLVDAVEEQWRASLSRWEAMNRLVLLEEAREMLCRAVCAWTSVPLAEGEAEIRAREFGAMIDGAGAIGPRNWRGRLSRMRAERWCRGVITEVRAGGIQAPKDSPLHIVAFHRTASGELLDVKIAAVELINLLRPTVAVDRYVVFTALALHEHPECRQRVAEDDGYLEMFVQEVRRFYPFFPFIGGRVMKAFEWRDRGFAEGEWALLDLYGTNHDARIWGDPERFRADRFRDWDRSAFSLIPQGGGDIMAGHRCAGEWATIEIMKRVVRLLTTTMCYDVPAQDLRIDLSRIPAQPNSRFVITGVTSGR